jgi:hypothetical protein
MLVKHLLCNHFKQNIADIFGEIFFDALAIIIGGYYTAKGGTVWYTQWEIIRPLLPGCLLRPGELRVNRQRKSVSI